MTTVTTLDPKTWPAHEVGDYMQRSVELRDLEPRSAEGPRACVVGSTGPFAQLAGRKALDAGGSSVDAAMTTAIAQIALAAGAWVSYAGIISVVHYDASSGEVSSLSGGYGTFRDERDPLTIPAAPTRSGRTAMVPGFFAGVQAAHDRFGVLPWSSIFAPAIHVAEEGFLLGPTRAMHFEMRRPVLSAMPEALAAFEGRVPAAGDVVRQRRLAGTLRAIAEDGTEYVYRGRWAQRFVALVRREGGKATLEDLGSYRATWSAPLRATFNGYEVCALGAPDVGGAALLEGLNLVEQAGIGDPLRDPDALYWLIQITRQMHVGGAMHTTVGRATPAERASKDHAARTWARMREAGGFAGPEAQSPGTHSDFVVAVDEAGNATAVCHSINTSMWGSTGMFVDGISIPDSACFQQAALHAVEPGSPLPNPTNPSIVLKDGTPVLALSSIGSGLPETTLQCADAILRRGLTPAEATRMPMFHSFDVVQGDSINTPVGATPGRDAGGSYGTAARGRPDSPAVIDSLLRRSGQVVLDTFDPAVLDGVRAKGVRLTVKPESDPTIPRGYFGGVSIDPASGAKHGARTSFCNGTVEAW